MVILITYVHYVIIKDEPQPAGFYDRDVVSTVRPGATMDHDGHEIIHPIRVHSVVGLELEEKEMYESFGIEDVKEFQRQTYHQVAYRVKQPQLEREDDPVRHLDEPVHLLHVFEPLQMQSQDRG